MTTRGRTAGVLVTALLVAACGQGAGHRAGPEQLVGAVQPLQHGKMGATDVSEAASRFGLDLMSRVCTATGPGTLLSPSSAFNALGMLDAASAGSTATAVSALMHLPGWNPAVIAAVHDQQAALAPLGTGSTDSLRTSDRVWPDVSVTPTQQFLDDVTTAYGATLQTLDFRHPVAATDAINRQVATDTDGLIPTLFGSPLDADTKAVLTDAVVLKAQWRDPFMAEGATTAFTTPTGTSQVMQMTSTALAGYNTAGGWQAAHLPYTASTLEAVVMLPPGRKACDLPSPADFRSLATTAPGLTSVTMPKLHLDQNHSLLETLRAMGLPVRGDYDKLGSSEITDVVQKDVMTVDELGTTAAGATGIAIAAASMSPLGTVHHLVFDRPYLLLLQDTATRTPLFLAWVNNPAA